MEKEITINGKKYALTPIIDRADESKTGYERLQEDENYYWCDANGGYSAEIINESDYEEDCYDCGNYYSDSIIAKNNTSAGALMQSLRQWQALNDAPVDWTDLNTKKWHILYDYSYNEFCPYDEIDQREPNTVYFTTQEKTKEAIDVFRDELMWYFTEYQQRLDEPVKEK